MTRRPKPRSFRPVSDELWYAAVARARSRGTTVSAVLNEALLDYVEGEQARTEVRDDGAHPRPTRGRGEQGPGSG